MSREFVVAIETQSQ